MTWEEMYNYSDPVALRRCPFCGSEGVVFEDDRYPNMDTRYAHRVYGVMCIDEGCIMHSTARFFRTEQAAKTAWNRRYKEADAEEKKE